MRLTPGTRIRLKVRTLSGRNNQTGTVTEHSGGMVFFTPDLVDESLTDATALEDEVEVLEDQSVPRWASREEAGYRRGFSQGVSISWQLKATPEEMKAVEPYLMRLRGQCRDVGMIGNIYNNLILDLREKSDNDPS